MSQKQKFDPMKRLSHQDFMSKVKKTPTKAFDLAFYATRKPCEYPNCQFCNLEWFAWYKARMRQMEVSKKGETSFAQAAATSVRAP